MATYYARKAGNINAADVWATTPSGTASAVTFVAGDILMANSFAIAVNVSTNLGSTGEVRNDAANGATAGGTFTLANGVTLTANIFAGTATCVTFSGASPNTASIIGNCTAGGSNGIAASNTGNGTLSIVGNCTGGSAATSSSIGVNNTGVGTINFTGNCTGGSAAGTFGVNNNAAGTINITGNCTAGSVASAHGANNNSTGTLTIIGPVSQGGNANITGGTSTGAFGANNASTGSMFITGPIYASEFDGGVGSANRSGLNFLTGPFYTSAVWGVNPIRCVSWRWATYLVNTTFIEVPTANLAAKRNLVTPDNATNFPVASNVRSGITYGIAGELVGTCAVPNPISVASGIAVDDTVGTLTTPTADQIRDSVWSATNRTLTNYTAPDNASIAAIKAKTDNLPTAPAAVSNIPTVVQIRTEMDSSSTRLSNLDASVSSRLASASYTAPTPPPTAAQNASAVWSAATRSVTGGTVDNLTNAPASVTPSDIWSHATRTLTSASGSAPTAEQNAAAVWSAATRTITGGTVDTLTNAPSVPSASAIASQVRTELSVELGRVDAAISTRATPANIPTSDITAIKVKTDALNTTRLAQVSTTEIVGNLLAQANS